MRKRRSKLLLLSLVTLIVLGGLIVYLASRNKAAAGYTVLSNTLPHCKTDLLVATCSSYSVKVQSDSGVIQTLRVAGFKDNQTDQTKFEAIGPQIDAARNGHKKVALTLNGDTITAITL